MSTVAPAAQCLLDQATALWPHRSRVSDGGLPSAAHSSANPTSDHEPDARGVGHAVDLTHDPAHGCDNNANAEQVKDDPRVKYVIWNRRIWNPSISKSWRAYSGSNPHDHHMHVSVLTEHENDTSPWFDNPEELTVAEIDRLIDVIKAEGAETRQLIKSDGKATRRANRRAVWTAQGKTSDEIDELEAAIKDD